jgi:hypothetical protein
MFEILFVLAADKAPEQSLVPGGFAGFHESFKDMLPCFYGY